MRKKKSAAKLMRGKDPWTQYQIAVIGPRGEELAEAVELIETIKICEELGKLDEYLKEDGLAFFKRLLASVRAGDGGFLRRMADVIELKWPVAEPWRRWLVANFRLPIGDGGAPMRAPETIASIQAELGNLFGYYPDDRKLRANLRALGVPFAPTKRGRRPAKPARRKKSS